jgi:hypothetical protein
LALHWSNLGRRLLVDQRFEKVEGPCYYDVIMVNERA